MRSQKREESRMVALQKRANRRPSQIRLLFAQRGVATAQLAPLIPSDGKDTFFPAFPSWFQPKDRSIQ